MEECLCYSTEVLLTYCSIILLMYVSVVQLLNNITAEIQFYINLLFTILSCILISYYYIYTVLKFHST